MDAPAWQCVVAGVLVLVGLALGLGLVRLAANAFILLVGVGAVVGSVYAVLSGTWIGWFQVAVRSLGLGLLAALVCLPALPFCSLRKRK